jgi:AcrR family transcriptional regulator
VADRPAALLDAPVGVGTQEERLVDATLVCVARWGLAKTSLDDVAREAGVSRATVYRAFPGGKDALVEAVARTELARFFGAVTDRLAAAADLEELLVVGLHEAGSRIARHGALRALLTYEPEVVLPRLAFDQMDEALGVASALAAPHLARFLDPETAVRAAEWVARLVVTYASWPSLEVDLADEASVRRLVATYVLPSLTTIDSQGEPA